MTNTNPCKYVINLEGTGSFIAKRNVAGMRVAFIGVTIIGVTMPLWGLPVLPKGRHHACSHCQ